MLSPPYRLRPLTVKDLDEALALWRRTEGVGLTEADTPDLLALFLERNPGLSVVVETDGKVVGTVLCGNDGRRGFLYHLAVAPEHRRAKLGIAMVKFCLEALAKQRVPKCNILVLADNESGKKFWKATGWKTRGDLELWQKLTTSP